MCFFECTVQMDISFVQAGPELHEKVIWAMSTEHGVSLGQLATTKSRAAPKALLSLECTITNSREASHSPTELNALQGAVPGTEHGEHSINRKDRTSPEA